MKRIFKNKFIACIIAAVLALSAAVLAVFYVNKNDNPVKAEATDVTTMIYWGVDGTVLTFDTKTVTGSPSGSFTGSTHFDTQGAIPWASERGTITSVVILNKIAPTSLRSWFYGLTSLTDIDLTNLDTSNVTNFNRLFYNCKQLTSINVSNFDTSKATDMAWMFNGCSGLTSLDLSKFECSHVSDFSDMLNGLNSLEMISLSNSLAKNITNTNLLNNSKTWYSSDGTEYTENAPMTGAGNYANDISLFHTHSFGDWTVTTPATCVATGLKSRTCSADGCPLTNGKETEVIPIDPNAHNYDTTTWKTDASNHWHECTLCQAVQPNSSAGHTAGAAATCTTDQTCTVCNRVLTPQLGHDWDTTVWHNDASGHWHECTHAGCNEKDSENTHNPDRAAADCVNGVTCTTCNYNIATAIGHNYSNDVTPPDCENGGYTTHTCANCNDSYVDNQVSANGHSWGAPVWQWAANYLTCKAKFTCSSCNKEQLETASITHNSATASCTQAGDTTHTASVTFEGVPYSDDKVISGQTLPHSGSLVSTTIAPTCTEDGVGEYKCLTCEKTYTDIIPSHGGHDIEHHDAKTANCTEAGWGEYDTCSRCDYTTKTEIPALDHDWKTTWEKDTTNHWHECSRCNEINDEAAHTHEWVITAPATTEADGLMENLCTECGHKDGEEVIAKLDDGNGNEIDLPVDIDVEFNVTQSNTGNDYSDIDKGLKRGYWAQLWYRNGDGTLGDEFTDKINCFLTLKIPDEIVKGILNGEPISRDKIAEGLSVYYIDENGTPVEVENFTIVLREDNSCQIKFNYNEKFRAEVVFAADVAEDGSEPAAGIPWWVWLLVVIGCLTVVGVVIIIIVVIKKKNNGDGGTTVVQGTQYDDAELKAKLSAQDRKLDEIKEIVDGGFNDVVDGE